jgi:putative FmdB family regulatory protein
MPTYEYVCTKCDQHLEVYQSFSEEPLKKHAGCGGKLTKVMGAVGIVLKGSGFYRTDNRTKAKSGESSKGESSKGESSKPAASDAKSGSTSESKPAAAEKKTEKKTA